MLNKELLLLPKVLLEDDLLCVDEAAESARFLRSRSLLRGLELLVMVLP